MGLQARELEGAGEAGRKEGSVLLLYLVNAEAALGVPAVAIERQEPLIVEENCVEVLLVCSSVWDLGYSPQPLTSV